MKIETTIDDQQKLTSSFTEIPVGQTTQFLEATNWNLEELINLSPIHIQNQPLLNQISSEQYWSDYQEEKEQIPLPLSSIRDALYDSSSMYETPVQVCPEQIWESEPGPSDSTRFSSLYRPPLNLVFEGSFEEAKSTCFRENLWLLVNLQSTTEFASYPRGLWSNDAVSIALGFCFILLQVHDDTIEGQEISTFYKIESAPPVMLLIDPITGQKMRSWSGEIEAQSFVDDLMNYIDCGPHEHIASLTSNKRIKTEKICFESNQTSDDQDMSTFWDDDLEVFLKGKVLNFPEKVDENRSSRNHIDHIEESAEGEEEEMTCLEFPVLTEEPKGDCDRSLVCSICVRFPDGRRKQRKFLKSEPIQLLWSFCYSQMEASERKAFKLVQAIPGACKTLDYGADATFDQSGLANSIISVT